MAVELEKPAIRFLIRRNGTIALGLHGGHRFWAAGKSLCAPASTAALMADPARRPARAGDLHRAAGDIGIDLINIGSFPRCLRTDNPVTVRRTPDPFQYSEVPNAVASIRARYIRPALYREFVPTNTPVSKGSTRIERLPLFQSRRAGGLAGFC